MFVRTISLAWVFCSLVTAPAVAQSAGKQTVAPSTKTTSPEEEMQAKVFAEIADSHIKGNVPQGTDFDKFLRRDLAAYFTKTTGKKVIVKYELLRNGPTQSGVAYPKYYLWVNVFYQGKRLNEGAVRVAAIEQKYFDITHFVAVSEIRKHPENLDLTFPVPVGNKIREHLGLNRAGKQSNEP